MAYMCEISPGQRVYLDSQGNSTVVTLMTGGSGQQQQASSSFQTGSWVSPPEIFAAPQGAVIKVNTVQGESYIQLQGSSITLSSASSVAPSQQMQVHQVNVPPAPTMTPMQPMQPIMPPMQPMQMQPMVGNREHNAPMEMRMGNMQMRMGEVGQPPQAAPVNPPVQATRKFCSQCGVAVEVSDRFCSSCGHRLA